MMTIKTKETSGTSLPDAIQSEQVSEQKISTLPLKGSDQDFSKTQTPINPNYNFYAKTLRMYGHTDGMLAGEATNWRSPRFSN